MRKLDISMSLKKRAEKVIPHLTQTFSRAAPAFVEGVYPVYAEKGNGSHFTDVDGNEYLDYLLGLGPITLGYNYESVNNAILNQLKNGILFSLPHKIEVELSELLCQIIPHAEMVKLEKSGSNAVTGAVRAARAITKKERIAYCGSGGVWHDWYAAAISRNGGVPEFNKNLIKIFDYNDHDGLEQIFEDFPNQIGAIVLEPTVYEKPNQNFLKKVREIADKSHAILILDEIVTGFRFNLGGAQKHLGIKGDFVCFGKGMGNGLPISAITGPSEFMKIFDKLWVSTTNGSENLSIAGTISVVNEMKNKDTISYCWKNGSKLLDGWNNLSSNYDVDAKMHGYPIRMTLSCHDSQKLESPTMKSFILQEMVKQGIFMSAGPTFLSYSHSSEDIEFTLNAFENVCKFIKENITQDEYGKKLEGNMPKTIYSHTIHPTKKRES